MKVGIVGAGFMGTTHAVGWAETPAEIVGFTAETQQEAAVLAERYKAKVYSSVDAMLPDIDVLDICSPTHLHHEMVLKAAADGKHIVPRLTTRDGSFAAVRFLDDDRPTSQRARVFEC